VERHIYDDVPTPPMKVKVVRKGHAEARF
jgi:hypothetical protein